VTKVEHGSVVEAKWSRDSNTVFCGFGDGTVNAVRLLEKSASNDLFSVSQVAPNKLVVSDVIHEIQEELEFPQSVTLFEFAHT